MKRTPTRLPWRVLAAAVLAAACAGVLACGSLDKSSAPDPAPTASVQPGTSGPNAPVMGAPAPKATPTPTPDPNATPTPGGGDTGSGEGADSCGKPLPPPLAKVNLNVHLPGAQNWILDSTPIVGPDPVYCKAIGFTDGRSYCPVRPEGNPERYACELYVMGRAKDTGRPGPTWYLDGHFCNGQASGCENNGDNQYLLNSYRGGVYKACGNLNGVCGELVVER